MALGAEGAFPTTGVLTAEFLGGAEGKLGDALENAEEGGAGEWELVKFKETPKMSTYLAAWAVGKFR